MEPLQVMPLDAAFNLVSGPLPYTSLMWERKYYEPGQFQMTVLSGIYDPSWAYIYTPFRPEMGIIQKVDCQDSSHTPDGQDTITISGFFLEAWLDNLVFLVEETEQEKVHVPKPSRPPKSAPEPNLKADADGNLYLEYFEGTDMHHYNNVETGECVWPSQVEGSDTWEDVPLSAGAGMREEKFPIHDADGTQTGEFSTGYYQSNFNYYSQDGKLHTVDAKGDTTQTYDIVGNGTNVVIYKDGDDYKWVWGVATSLDDAPDNKYRREVEQWERLQQSLPTEEYMGQDGVPYYYRTVKGAWQLRTDIDDVTTPQDNVQWVIKMAQRLFGNNYLYDEPDFQGETKVLSPSLTRVGDFFRGELKTVEASVRTFYSFTANQMTFQIWRGLDRTQDANSPTIDDAPSPTALTSRASVAEGDFVLPDGYRQFQYIASNGSQYIDTGFKPDSNSRVEVKYNASAEGYVVAAENDWKVNSFDVHTRLYAYGTGSMNLLNTFDRDVTVDMNKNVVTADNGHSGTINASTFTTSYSFFIFSDNRGGVSNEPMTGRIYYVRIYDNGTKVRDYVPAMRESDGAVGFYDLVDGVFYGNSGTGAFTTGPEIPRPEEPEPEPEPVPQGNPWAVFSDTWGSLYDYDASRDDSNYRNLCYVMYEYDEPVWDDDGRPKVTTITGETALDIVGYQVQYNRQRGYTVVRLQDEYPDRETWLDLRSEKPECDGDWPRDFSETEPEIPDTVTKDVYDQFRASFEESGRAHLVSKYPIETNVDTGTISQDGYIVDWDLGDKVDLSISRIGVEQTARIIGCTEVHESGSSTVRVEMGESQTTFSKKWRV